MSDLHRRRFFSHYQSYYTYIILASSVSGCLDEREVIDSLDDPGAVLYVEGPPKTDYHTLSLSANLLDCS